ncbi:MAG: WD40 repeat domain-containing protein [Desertifilum sp.]|nr:WD40 repeat domain-containing protein [Desertifilum sp.]
MTSQQKPGTSKQAQPNDHPIIGNLNSYLNQFSTKPELGNLSRNEVICSVISPDEKTIIGGGWKVIRTWNATTGKLLGKFTAHTGWVLSVAITPNGKILASGGGDNKIHLWDLNTGNCLNTLSGHSGSIKTLKITTDGSKLVSGSTDKTIKIWNLSSGALLYTLEKHSYSVESIAISNNNLFLASCDKNKVVNIWKLNEGSFVGNFKDHLDRVQIISARDINKVTVFGTLENKLSVLECQFYRSLNYKIFF